MTPNNKTSDHNHEITGAIDTEDFSRPHFIIADTTTDDAWIAIPDTNAATLEDWE